MAKGKGKEPEGIGDIIEALKKSAEVGKHFGHALIWERWPELAGPQMMHHGRPLGVRDGTLLVEIDSAVWMHRFSYEKEAIMERIRRIVDPALVSDLFFTLTAEEELKNPQDDV